ncbi:hypothetical protein LINGRAHAP2_LOCUS18810 [Linum grandiflorum]
MSCAVGHDTLPVGNCSQYGKFDSYETSEVFMEKGLAAAGPLSEIKQHKAKNGKSYRRTMVVVPESNSNHYNGAGDSCMGKGQENCLKNQWSGRSYSHQKKILVGKHHYGSVRVELMPGEIRATQVGYPTEGSAKSLCWVPVHKLNPSSSPYFLRQGEVDYWKESTDPGSHGLNWHCQLVNSSAKKADFCNYLNAESAAYGDEHKGVRRSSGTHRDEFQPRGEGMNLAAHSATYKPFHGSVYSKSSMVFNHGCQAKPVRWVPAAAKASKILQKVHRGANFTSQCRENIPFDRTDKTGTDLTSQCREYIPCDRTDKTDTKGKVNTGCLSSDKKPAVASEPSKPCDNVTWDEPKSESPKKIEETDEFVGSRAVIESLTAAYKQQLLSEIIQFTVGYPLADFETFIKHSSPVITSSVSSVSEREVQTVSLSGLWNWYEKPGSLGLKVRIEACQYLNGFIDKKAPFDAHFVPSLSAVQLFGYSKGSSSPNLGAKSDTCGQKVLFSNVVQCTDHGKVKLISSSPCSNNPELLFEFFESEQPYNRKPLHLKITELIDSGTSNSQVYGDPQKLVSLMLNEVHPASWFSVAWYPIYRIPEGKLRSCFLTYHSLGHFVRKGGFPADSPSNTTSHTLFPAVGLQSLNTQGECWFNLKRRAENSPKQSSVGDSEILKRRLQTLEGNASLLARGCVTKDNIKVNNRQSDYEFFVSRRH